MKILFVFLFSLSAFAEEDLLKIVDSYRNPGESYVMGVTIKSSGGGDPSKFLCYLKGNDKTLVKVLGPKENVGRNMLMLGENMWVYVPNIRRSVRVSLNQKLTGEAANGDISRMRWSGDYEYKIEKTDKQEITLMLTAVKEGLTYAKIRAWISAQDKRPLRAEFLTLSGKTIKTAAYEDYKDLLGKKRPTKIHIVDHLKKDQFSDILIEKMENKKFPDTLFTEKSLE